MTQSEIEKLEMQVVYKAHTAKRDLKAHTIKLALIGETLGKFATVLQDCPNVVASLPEIQAPDYREALNMLNPDLRREVIELCQGVRDLQRACDTTEKRKESLGL
jgi:hypothetical protein